MNGALAAIAAMLLVASPAAAARKKPVPAPVAPAPVVPSVKAGVEAWRAGDYPAAVAMWMPFANAGDMDAMFNIGQAYKLGRAVPKDTVIARDWYRRAALKGHLPAQANLGILLFQAGEKSEAIRWLKSAADKNEMRAQYVLGVALWNGDGAPRSLTLAYGYLARASAQGLPEATTALNTLTGSISPLERANGWAVATSLAAGNGIPPEFAGPAPRPVAADSFNRDQVIKPPPRIAAVEAPRIAAVEAPR
ncbi:MAG: tetratricopeptide repeat protein, partial [Polymorphobacter sp.]